MNADFLKNLAVKLEKRQDKIFTFPLSVQKKYVNHFPEPESNMERSYFQYLCQMKLYGKLVHLFLCAGALPLSLFFLIKSRKQKSIFVKKAEAVFYNGGLPENIIPSSLRQRYAEIESYNASCGSLEKNDVDFLKTIFKKYPFSWFLWLKCIIKISQYSYIIKRYSPDTIIACSEFSYTSSVLTEYCHTQGIKHINVMHGEKLYYMRDSFVNFDEYYVWSKEYADLLMALRAGKEQFRIEVPPSLDIKPDFRIEKKYDFTYYLGSESANKLLKISGILKSFCASGYKVSVRPHPRYSSVEEVKSAFPFANVEDIKKVTIEESLLQTGSAISVYSTVLNQAYNGGIDIVIDDISDPVKYSELRSLQYTMMSVKHRTLSEIYENLNKLSIKKG